MGRRSLKNKPEIELFPFLSVLACTIGSLILLIIVISTQTLDSNPEVTILAQTEVGQNRKKQPRYIECQSGGIIIYPSKTLVPLAQIDQPDSPLQKLIENEKIDIGYEPIQESWTLKINQE